jgi:hypothetical protein
MILPPISPRLQACLPAPPNHSKIDIMGPEALDSMALGIDLDDISATAISTENKDELATPDRPAITTSNNILFGKHGEHYTKPETKT